MSWEIVIGLEVHAQLATRVKIFSGAADALTAPRRTRRRAWSISATRARCRC